jgi:hypothetical protein
MRRIVLIVLAVLIPGCALAQAAPPGTTVTGNLPDDFYPKPSCLMPSSKKLIKPSYDDPGGVGSYNAGIRQFNKDAAAYNGCMQAYNAKVGNDIQGILSTVNSAVAEATGRPPPPPAAAGNLPLGFYPKNSCLKPDHDALGVMPSPKEVKAMTAYNLRAKTYNDQVSVFSVCLKTYQDKAQRDIDHLQAVAHSAVMAGP